MADPADELVEWVDEDGSVIEVVTRRRMRAETLRHRSTYVAVVTSSRELVVHRRADWKDVYPGHWDIAFGGVPAVGEDWEHAARRELSEEAGIDDVELVLLGSSRYDEADGRVVGQVWVVSHDGPLDGVDGEVAAIDRVGFDALDQWLGRRTVCADSLQIVLPVLRKYLAGEYSGPDSGS